MDLTLSKSDLQRALQVTLSTVAKRSTMPILSNLLLSASESELRISSSDLEITSVARVKAEVRTSGSTTVSSKVFSDIVRELPDGEISLSLKEGERTEICAKNSRFKIIGISAEEYPSLPGIGFELESRVSAGQLLEMIQRTLYAVSHDETRFNLNGVCFETDGKEKGKKKGETKALRLIATDGHRLAMVTRPLGNLEVSNRVIVPKRGLSEIRRILEAESDKEVGVGIREGFFLLETNDFKVSMRLIDGEYPDCSMVIPQDKGTVATINSEALSQALRRVMLMVTDREKCVRMTFHQNSLKISSSSPELGEASEELPITYEGSTLTVGFNAAYLLEVASALSEGKNLCIELHGELGPGKFFEQNDESSLAIVMPMRL